MWPDAHAGYRSVVSEIDSGAWLTVGPRRRRLLWSVIADGLIGPAWPAALVGTRQPDAAELVTELEPAVEGALGECAEVRAALRRRGLR
jgi:hypothetical protein